MAPTSQLSPPSSATKKELDTWSRVIAKRKADWGLLDEKKVEEMISRIWDAENPKPFIEGALLKLEWLLTMNLYRSLDTTVDPERRRLSLLSVKMLLVKLDGSLGSAKSNTESLRNDQKNEVNSNMRFALQELQKNTENLLANPTKPVDSSESTWMTSRIGAQKVGAQRANWRSTSTADPSPKSKIPSITRPGSSSSPPARPSPAAQAASTQKLPPRKNAPSTSSTQPPPVAAAKLAPGQKSSSPMAVTPVLLGRRPFGVGPTKPASVQIRRPPISTSAVAKQPQRPQSVHTQKIVSPPQPAKSWKACTLFAKDNNRFSAALKSRNRETRLIFTLSPLSQAEVDNTKNRLMKWDPYWQMVEIVAITMTALVERREQMPVGPDPPKRALTSTFQIPESKALLIKDWGKPKNTRKYEHGETRLILRMLPLNLKKPKPSKKQRADTHLWPMGTFLQVGGKAKSLQQRRQQAHDYSEWKGMCHALDLTPHIDKPSEQTKIDICTIDNQPFIMCVSVCQYQSADSLFESLQANNVVHRMPKQEGLKVAQQMTRQNLLVLDDDIKDNNDERSFIFKLTCPISSSIMKTPVRPRSCSHFQCFDFMNFLCYNQHITGTRWECPVCNKNIVSVVELTLCEFTESLIKQYKSEASSFRDRIELFSRGTWQLRGENKKRYSSTVTKRPAEKKANGEPEVKKTRTPAQQEVIELL